jgi:hypothetical protein
MALVLLISTRTSFDRHVCVCVCVCVCVKGASLVKFATRTIFDRRADRECNKM